jgi:hypothetical protein
VSDESAWIDGAGVNENRVPKGAKVLGSLVFAKYGWTRTFYEDARGVWAFWSYSHRDPTRVNECLLGSVREHARKAEAVTP